MLSGEVVRGFQKRSGGVTGSRNKGRVEGIQQAFSKLPTDAGSSPGVKAGSCVGRGHKTAWIAGSERVGFCTGACGHEEIAGAIPPGGEKEGRREFGG
jgi:hypothetical protein